MIRHGHRLAANGGVAAGIGRSPGAGGVESAAAFAGGIGHGAEDGDGRGAAGVSGGRRIKSPGAGALDGLVGRAGDARRGRVAHGDGLHHIGAVAGVVGRGPGAGDDLGAAATIADNVTVTEFYHRAAGVLGNGHAGDVGAGVRDGALENYIGWRGDDGRGRVTHGDSLDTSALVAAIISGRPGAVNQAHGAARARNAWWLRRRVGRRPERRVLLRRRQRADLVRADRDRLAAYGNRHRWIEILRSGIELCGDAATHMSWRRGIEDHPNFHDDLVADVQTGDPEGALDLLVDC